MRPLFRGEGCTVDGAGISSAANPLTRLLDGATNDPLHARQMREGYLGGFRPPMGPLGPHGQMLDPMVMKPGGSPLDQAWQEAGPMAPRPMGPALGETMREQLRRHMEQGGDFAPQEPGFFSDFPGAMAMPPHPGMGDAWAQEFAGPHAGGYPGGPGPQGLLARPAMRPPSADWASEFAAQRMPAPGFHQAQMPPPAVEQMGAVPGPASSSSSVFHGPVPMPMPMGPMMRAPLMAGPMPMPAMGWSPPPVEVAPAPVPAQIHPPLTDAVDMEAAFKNAEMDAALNEAQQQQEAADLGQAVQMVEMLRNSGNPKFANSQFVNFIDKVSKGDLQFKENTVIDRQGNEVDWEALYDTDAANVTEAEREELEDLWRGAANSPPVGGLEKAWKDADLEEVWRAAGGVRSGPDFESIWRGAEGQELADAWRLAHGDGDAGILERAWMDEDLNMEQFLNMGKSEYEFSKDNPYLDSADPLAEAQRLIREGRDREALMALEAEVQRNPESSEGWRQLGQLYAELDQDVEAIQCLKKGHEVDPYNLDSLLALGVSCTNELDQLPALQYLRMWIENHEEHACLVQGLDQPAQYEFEAWRQQVTMLFNQAAQNNPLDANVFVALGVMENINRSYESAIAALATACRLRPNDHTIWNKLGATLANSGKSEQAVIAYHQGLQLKPNYARSWSNLAIAHANLGQHENAARFYLSSLVLNPEATHIWGFLHSAALNMNSPEACKAVDQRDIEACSRLIEGVLDPVTLPKPTSELPSPPDEILASIGL